MLAGAPRGEKRSGVGGDRMKFLDVDTGGLLGLKYKLICHLKLVAGMVRSGTREL